MSVFKFKNIQLVPSNRETRQNTIFLTDGTSEEQFAAIADQAHEEALIEVQHDTEPEGNPTAPIQDEPSAQDSSAPPVEVKTPLSSSDPESIEIINWDKNEQCDNISRDNDQLIVQPPGSFQDLLTDDEDETLLGATGNSHKHTFQADIHQTSKKSAIECESDTTE